MLTVRFNIDPLLTAFDQVQKRQVPFALAQALNDTAKDGQAEARTGMYAKLSIRQAQTRSRFERAIYFARDGYADSKKGKFSAEVRIRGNERYGGTSSSMARIGAIMIRQELGGTREGSAIVRRGNQFVLAGNLIPFEGLRSPTKSIPQRLYPKAIGLSPRSAIEGGETLAGQYKGGKVNKNRKRRGGPWKNGTRFYFATDKGIFVREQLASGESEYDSLWWFSRVIKLQPRLGFRDSFERAANRTFAGNFLRRLDAALRTARL